MRGGRHRVCAAAARRESCRDPAGRSPGPAGSEIPGASRAPRPARLADSGRRPRPPRSNPSRRQRHGAVLGPVAWIPGRCCASPGWWCPKDPYEELAEHTRGARRAGPSDVTRKAVPNPRTTPRRTQGKAVSLRSSPFGGLLRALLPHIDERGHMASVLPRSPRRCWRSVALASDRRKFSVRPGLRRNSAARWTRRQRPARRIPARRGPSQYMIVAGRGGRTRLRVVASM